MEEIVIEAEDPKKTWISGHTFEQILVKNKNKIQVYSEVLTFKIPEKNSLSLDTIIRLLNLLNQLATKGKKVNLHFLGNENISRGYLLRMKFFELIARSITVSPLIISKPNRSKLSNSSLIEIELIKSKSQESHHLPGRLTDVIVNNIEKQSASLSEKDKSKLTVIFKTIFMELINNIHEHSHSSVDGVVALQVYGGPRPRAEVIICDSGLGMLNTIRPSLKTHNAKFEHLTDSQLVKKMLSEGLSSKDPSEYAGNGLCACFIQASKIKSDITIRLDHSFHRLHKVHEYENPFDSLQSMDNLQRLDGTFICFEIPLNNIIS